VKGNAQSREAGNWMRNSASCVCSSKQRSSGDGILMANDGKQWQTTANDSKQWQATANEGK